MPHVIINTIKSLCLRTSCSIGTTDHGDRGLYVVNPYHRACLRSSWQKNCSSSQNIHGAMKSVGEAEEFNVSRPHKQHGSSLGELHCSQLGLGYIHELKTV
ncbi:hypothetical protein TNCV_4765141 [Trichonephila clavipes]|nr:hypothetical protein TNCV_4765141 [Trichonephila clavipes]